MPKIVNHEKYKTEILSKCVDILARKGYSAVSMREIATELDVSTGTLYHYFATKEDIFKELVKFLLNKDIEEIQLYSKGNLGQTLESKVESLFQMIQDREAYFQNLLYIICDASRLKNHEEEKSLIADAMKEYADIISKHFGITNPALNRILISVILGTVIQRIVDEDGIHLSDSSEIIKDFLSILLSNSFTF
ncbi:MULTISPECIES: TetR/AcrR family transcriptional regulator [Leptospira]|uniref:Transcriptional regulator, TetR family n=4 Tax=Leptospira weilii TaxID=28184 RepID=A0A828Z8C4_9LEPT|nr:MULTISPECIES: TetR/AcrR family transcriptional regulator [Leptospira]EMM73195.1 transcriptional regulator, TetR family [Leptospira weilii str. 2006001855]EMY12354.1 transcriptional regulator, TetR family [Leptospira weilii str. Ecochallenge]EKR66535.1 transcriptional regulator, TetR family [Leptospira weilii str. 2006001853]EMJ59542.1 transcriptional regulator, TetR family [Leptospira sp. P2653]EMN45257.1 transcriptional regulator, TetR family [Leptospira weilii str. LNT 1234]